MTFSEYNQYRYSRGYFLNNMKLKFLTKTSLDKEYDVAEGKHHLDPYYITVFYQIKNMGKENEKIFVLNPNRPCEKNNSFIIPMYDNSWYISRIVIVSRDTDRLKDIGVFKGVEKS